MDTKNKNILIGGLLAIILIMAVGYAAFATQLNINGTAAIASSWDVHIESVTPGTPVGSASVGAQPVISNGDLTATLSTNLVAPGDSLTYTVRVANGGSLDAKLTGLEFSGGTNTAIIHSYEGVILNTTVVPATGSKYIEFTVTVTYNPAIQTQPENTTSNLSLNLTFTQA